MNTKKILLSLFAGVVGATVTSVSAMAAETFTIDSAQALIDYAALVNGGAETSDDVVTVTTDIDLGDVEWTPIGRVVRDGSKYISASTPFEGTFDGGNYKISGLKISDGAKEDGIGLFGGIAEGAYIENVNLVNVEISAPNCRNTGGIVGVIAGGTVENCTVSGEISGLCAGGIVGRMLADGTVEGCVNKATITATGSGDTGGGIVGKAYYTKSDKEMNIIDCVNEGDIIGDGAYGAGGIAGFSTGNVIGCTNNGKVVATGAASAAGIVSEHGMYGEVSGNINNANISAVDGNTAAGGIIGWLRYTGNNTDYEISEKVAILNNINNGSISSTSNSTTAQGVGGIVGAIYGKGTVSGNKNSADSIIGVTHAAGIVGYSINAGGTTPADIQIDGNVSSTPVENITAGVVEQFAYAGHGGVTVSDNAVAFAAEVDNVKYASIASAVNNADENSVITLLSDIELAETVVITAKNITINGDGYTVKGADLRNVEQALLTAVTPFEVNNATVTFENIIIRGGNIDTATDLMNAGSYGYAGSAVKVVNKGTVNIYDSELYGGNSDAQWIFTIGSAINASDDSVIYADNSTISAGTPENENTFYLPAIIADNTTKLSLYDVTISSPKGKSASGGADGIISAGIGDQGDESYYTAPVTIGGTITIPKDSISLNTLDLVFDGPVNFVGKIAPGYIAEKLAVKYVPVAQDAEEDEQSDLYNIVIASTQKIKKYTQDENGDYAEVETDTYRYINRLNSADFTFVMTADSDMDYEIIASNPEIKINPVNNLKDRYEFHFDGKNKGVLDTASEIVIGQVKVSGYGTYSFTIDADAIDEADDKTNVVHATKTADSIVDTFTYEAGNLAFGDGIIDAYIAVPTRDLTINIDFPNAIVDRVIAYNDMIVTVYGGDLAADIIIALGNDAEKTVIGSNDNKKEAYYEAKFVDGAYVVTLTNILTVNNSYNVEVSGEGYRTARYTVTMNCDDSKTLNFWNNVKDNAIAVEEGKDSSEKNVTFLAGDIVKDSVINIYDLSAVVSYFGEVDLSETKNASYVKYDLNRDGKIDSKDVAYVLVSWGK